MIDPNKCQTCFPIVAKIFEVKFEGEKIPKQCVMRAWKECDQPAVEHITDYTDLNNSNTMFVIHRCAIHVAESKQIHESIIKNESTYRTVEIY